MKRRESNIELCRIISIILVLILHSTFQSCGWPTMLNTGSIFLVTLASFSIVGVNVFVLITGYFSTTLKRSSILGLFFICFFYAVLGFLLKLLLGYPTNVNMLFFVSRSNWFIPCYLTMLMFTPLLNKCDQLTKRELGSFVLLLLFAEVWLGYFPAMPSVSIGFNHGYSVLSFIIMYLVGRYLRLYGLPSIFIRYSFVGYILCSLLLVTGSILLLKYGYNITHLYDYNSPVVIISSICLFITFSRISLDSLRVNYIAKSTLSVLLIHGSAVFFIFVSHFSSLFQKFNSLTIIIWLFSIAMIYCGCVLIDQTRILLYDFLINKIKLFQ